MNKYRICLNEIYNALCDMYATGRIVENLMVIGINLLSTTVMSYNNVKAICYDKKN